MPLELLPRKEMARNRVTGELSPMFPDERRIVIDGVMFGYCTLLPGRPVTLIRRVSDSELASIQAHVEAEIRSLHNPAPGVTVVTRVSQPPPEPSEPVSPFDALFDDSADYFEGEEVFDDE